MPTPPLPVIERALETNFGNYLEDVPLPPDEVQIEWERRHTRHARLLTDAVLRRGVVVWAADESLSYWHREFRHARRHPEGSVLVWAQEIAAEFSPQTQPVLAEDPLLSQFRELARKWHEETDHLSSPTDIAMNFNYQQIIGKGERFLPFIFDELRTNGGNWYWALRAITGGDPVLPADRGSVAKMKQAWLNWWGQNN